MKKSLLTFFLKCEKWKQLFSRSEMQMPQKRDKEVNIFEEMNFEICCIAVDITHSPYLDMSTGQWWLMMAVILVMTIAMMLLMWGAGLTDTVATTCLPWEMVTHELCAPPSPLHPLPPSASSIDPSIYQLVWFWHSSIHTWVQKLNHHIRKGSKNISTCSLL